MNEVVAIVPGKTDADFAAELKNKVVQAYQPLFEILLEAEKKGFHINVAAGKNPLGKWDFAQLQVVKVY